MENTNAEKAFHWIIGILQNHNIPFEIDGGLAARAYGADRELADIDIVIPEEKFPEIVSEVKEYIVSGPERLVDEFWDLWMLKLDYEGQIVELAGAYEQKYFDKASNEWVSIASDFNKSEIKEVFSVTVPIMPKEKLIQTKRSLGREVDIVDLKFLEE